MKEKKIDFKKEVYYTKVLCELINSITKTYLVYTSNSYIQKLIKVMDKFPKFVEQLPTLVDNKIIIFDEVDFKFKWNCDKTSIAQYFVNIKEKTIHPCNGFWADIEDAFDYKKDSLRHLATKNGRGAYFKPSDDYIKIINLFPNEKEKKYYDKIQALEDMFNEHNNNYFWKDDGKNTSFIEFCEAKFDEIRKIIGVAKDEQKDVSKDL